MNDASGLALASEAACRLQDETATSAECALAELQLRLPMTPVPHLARLRRPLSGRFPEPVQQELYP